MSPKNIRQPITITPKHFAYDKNLQGRFALVISGIVFALFAIFCLPLLIVIQINIPRQLEPTATIHQVARTTATNATIASRTPRPAQSTSTPQIPFTSTSKKNPVAEISCANKLYKVNLRRTPGYTNKDDSYDSLYEVPCGEIVELLGDTENVDGLTWWHIEWNGYKGWIADHTASGKIILIFDP